MLCNIPTSVSFILKSYAKTLIAGNDLSIAYFSSLFLSSDPVVGGGQQQQIADPRMENNAASSGQPTPPGTAANLSSTAQIGS